MIVKAGSKSGLLHFFGAIVMGTAFIVSASYAADSSQKPLSFSNKDLEPYESSKSQRLLKEDSHDPRGSGPKQTKTSDSREQKEKEHWCKKASEQRRKIQRLNDDISEKEQQLAEESRGGAIRNKKTTALNKAIAKTQKRLKYAEGDLRALEDEAYRKGVPHG